jgi:cytosine/uracil/thiamine/allantoin permease
MKQSWSLFAFLLFLAVTLAGCQVIGDIFKAGVWAGVLLVILVLGIIVWLVTRSTLGPLSAKVPFWPKRVHARPLCLSIHSLHNSTPCCSASSTALRLFMLPGY